MKTWALPLLMFVGGAVVGISVTHLYWMRIFRAAIPSAIQCLDDRQYYSCALSLAALDKLEAGEADRAKFLLAGEAASYYQHPLERPDSPRRKEILTHIEATRTKSSVLDQELRKKPQ